MKTGQKNPTYGQGAHVSGGGIHEEEHLWQRGSLNDPAVESESHGRLVYAESRGH